MLSVVISILLIEITFQMAQTMASTQAETIIIFANSAFKYRDPAKTICPAGAAGAAGAGAGAGAAGAGSA